MVSVKESDSYNLDFNWMRRTLKSSRRLAECSDEISSRLIYLLSKPGTANVIALRIGKLNDHRSSVIVGLSNDHVKIIVVRFFLKEQNDASDLQRHSFDANEPAAIWQLGWRSTRANPIDCPDNFSGIDIANRGVG